MSPTGSFETEAVLSERRPESRSARSADADGMARPWRIWQSRTPR